MLNIPRRHVRGLLYHLAAQSTPSPRANLCLLLWPDIPEANARRNLTRALTHLRRALPAPTALITDEETVQLDKQSFWCDALELRKLIQAEADARDLGEAVDLYRGSFLEGFYLPGCLEFERWASQEGGALENIYLGALSRLIEAETAKQDYGSAIQYARRYLASDEMAEEMHCRLIWLYALNGERIKALRQFEACVSILERELGTRPLSETRAIYESVLEGKLPGQRAEMSDPSLASPSGLVSRKVPLVGRAATMRHLEDCLREANVGHSRVVLISGEPGIGKSRLLADFAERCRQRNPVLVGAGQLAAGSVPFTRSWKPFVQGLLLFL
jgi:DNA-binding SARP family transcriptional activator